jgi:hypothetical protein
VEVADAGKHAALAGLSGMYLAYCSIERKGEAPRTIAAAFTSGGGDNLMVGRGGVFYDRQGRDWMPRDEDHRQSREPRRSLLEPVQEAPALCRGNGGQARRRFEAGVTGGMTGAVVQLAAGAGKARRAQEIDVGTVAALGVAFAAAGTMLSVLATGLMGLRCGNSPSFWRRRFS